MVFDEEASVYNRVVKDECYEENKGRKDEVAGTGGGGSFLVAMSSGKLFLTRWHFKDLNE